MSTATPNDESPTSRWGSFRLTDRVLAADAPHRLYLRPLGLLTGRVARDAVEAGEARWLAGGPVAFAACQILLRDGEAVRRRAASLSDVETWAGRQNELIARYLECLLARLTGPRPPFAGLSFDRPRIMGVINVTPDSFSDGGDAYRTEDALARGRDLARAGADVLDVGGESTRPGSEAVFEAEELVRTIPVLEGLASDPGAAGAVLSVDTWRPGVMEAGLAAGARIINDVTALGGDARSPAVAAQSGAAVVLMHMQGEPRTMQEAPAYDFAPLDVFDVLAERIAAAEAAGIARGRIAVDPGIGFGKAETHNLELLSHLSLFHGLGCAVVLGVSRKSFISRISCGEVAKARVPGTIAANQVGLDQGVQILRVHDVEEARQAIAVHAAIAAEA